MSQCRHILRMSRAEDEKLSSYDLPGCDGSNVNIRTNELNEEFEFRNRNTQ